MGYSQTQWSGFGLPILGLFTLVFVTIVVAE
jgi:hypothetical protein